ncbi:MAG: hypothetical protein K0S98_2072, partial [Propionibacteriaceae bacterium]|nr:hypothetical protein [Propionibacteriaceae bacterium]
TGARDIPSSLTAERWHLHIATVSFRSPAELERVQTGRVRFAP